MTKLNRKRGYKSIPLLYLFVDLIIVGLSFLIFIWIKPASLDSYFPRYIKPFILFAFLWVIISSLLGKYRLFLRERMNDIVAVITFSNVTIIAIVTSLLFLFNRFGYSRMIVFGTILISSIIEYFIAIITFSIQNAKVIDEEFLKSDEDDLDNLNVDENRYNLLNEDLLKSIDSSFLELARKYTNDSEVYVNSLNNEIDLNVFTKIEVSHIIDLHSINGVYGISKYFSKINKVIPINGIYIGKVETYNIRKERILKRLPFPVNRIDYFIDFMFSRVLPKLIFTRGIYFFFFRKRDRVLSKAEIFGRLYAAGFEIIDEQVINDELFYISKKVKRPFVLNNPSYGFLITLNRHGKDGEKFKVYKLRTMHAFAEFLQEYVYKKHNLQEGGKFKDDFRITATGRFLRRFWLDEIPMIFNLFKGDMKLVGVRPLSSHYFSLYSDSLKEKRIKYKPGLIPPFYVDLPKTFEEIMDSELKYLESYERSPFFTDWKYFWKAFYNIFVKRVRGN